MHIITKKAINLFIDKHPDSKEPLVEWYLKTSCRAWKNLHDIKETFNSVDYVGNDLYVFNVGGNKYRIIARIFLKNQLVYIRFVGTHAEYDRVNLDRL